MIILILKSEFINTVYSANGKLIIMDIISIIINKIGLKSNNYSIIRYYGVS